MLWSTFKASVKGIWGEKLVQAGAALTLPSLEYRKYHNVTLPTPRGTTQIDHVFVSAFGVFVVETKNMAGWIYGSEQDREWTQVFPGGQKFKFQNPLRQNYGHVQALEDALAGTGTPRGVVRSVVIFVGKAKLKRELPENVTVGFGGARYIRSFRNRTLSEAQVALICELVESRRIKPSWKTDRQHIRDLERESSSATRQCPRCGQEMVLRTARRGQSAGKQLWGCKGFPACRMVQDK